MKKRNLVNLNPFHYPYLFLFQNCSYSTGNKTIARKTTADEKEINIYMKLLLQMQAIPTTHATDRIQLQGRSILLHAPL